MTSDLVLQGRDTANNITTSSRTGLKDMRIVRATWEGQNLSGHLKGNPCKGHDNSLSRTGF